MEPVRKKAISRGAVSDSRDEMALQLEELEKTQTLELEQKLLNIIDDAWTLLISGFSTAA